VSREAMLARTLVELADTLVDDFELVDLLATLTERCVEVLDVAAVGILLAEPGADLRVMGWSSEALHLVELFELQAQEGPCLDCYRSGDQVVNEDLDAATDRWPRFAPVAIAAGYHAVDAVPMRLRRVVIGALNLFRTEPTSLSDDDVVAAQAIADLATISILQHHAISDAHTDNLQLGAALDTRMIVEQATGIVAERQGIETARAFARIRNHARRNDTRLADVASRIIDGSFNPAALDARGT
jgi:GAF domain-containing protein